jgi:hypothetical protein
MGRLKVTGEAAAGSHMMRDARALESIADGAPFDGSESLPSIDPGTERREQIFVYAPSLTSTASTKSSVRLPHCGAAPAIYRSPKSQRRLQPHRAAVN